MYVICVQTHRGTPEPHFLMIPRYNEQKEMMEGSPTLIEEQWPGIPYPIDAAVFYDGCEITLLLSDKRCHNITLHLLNEIHIF